jgi:PTS system nitrogen regulatory IIA component
MAHTLAALRALIGRRSVSPRLPSRRTAARDVVMHVTLDAQHATPLRQALIRDCGDQPWTIRLAVLPDTGRVRLSLYLPKAAVNQAMQHVARLAPASEGGRLLFEIPPAPTGAWRDLMHGAPQTRAGSPGQPVGAATAGPTIAGLLSADHVLLGLDVASPDALFAELGSFLEQRYRLPGAIVTTGLAEREALGSTGLGQGVAVPHGHIDGLGQAMVLYVRPATPIPFDAPDGNPVSDVVVLLVPAWADSTHLHLLAEVAQRFCDHHFREQLRACLDARAVCKLFAGYDALDDAVHPPALTEPG